MKTSTKTRISVAIIAGFVDLLLAPAVLRFLSYIKPYGVKAPEVWIKEFSIVDSFLQLFTDSMLRNLWLALQPITITLILLLFWKDMPKKKYRIQDGVGGPEAAGNGQFGSSRWLTEEEIEKTTTPWKLGSPLKRGGIVVGMDLEKLKAWLTTDDENTLLIGTTRSGKSRTVVLPSIWELAQAGESMVISDLKGELYHRSSSYLKEKGYKVVLIDLRNPGRGNRYNPMYRVNEAINEGDFSKASEMAWDIAHMYVHSTPRSGDPVWANGEESVIASLILAIALEADDEKKKHLTSVYTTLIELGQVYETEDGVIIPLNDYFQSLPRGHLAKNAFGTAAVSPYRTRASFFGGASSTLRLFADPSIAYLTSEQDHDLKDSGREKTAVFLVVPDEKSTRYSIATLYVDQTYQALVELANECGGRLPIRVNMLLDEFGNFPAIKDFHQKLTVSLGRGIKWTPIIQDFGQLEEKYGRNIARIIRGNCHTWLYLLTTDPLTAKEISEKTGKYTVETETYSSSVQSKSHSKGFSTGLTGRALLTQDEILRWPVENALVLRARQFPAHLPLPDLSKWPADRELIPDQGGDEKRKIGTVEIYVPGSIEEGVNKRETAAGLEKVEQRDYDEQDSILDQID